MSIQEPGTDALTEPLLEAQKSDRPVVKKEDKPKIENFNEANVEQVFKYMEDLSKKACKASKIPVNFIKSTLTPNGNMLSYSLNSIDLYNLSTEKTIFTQEKKLACCAYVTPMNTRIFCGYVDGTLESRDPTTLAVLQTAKLNSKILDLISDNKTIYAGLRNGRIVALPIMDINAPLNVIKKIDKKNPISMLKLSKDNSFLLGYVDVDNNETFYVINLAKKDEKPW